MLDELADLVLVVDDERVHAEAQRIADVAVALDRMRVDAAIRRHPDRSHQRRLAVGGQVEARAQGCERAHDGSLGQRLERVVQLDVGQCLGQLAIAVTQHVAVDQQQRRTIAGDQRLQIGTLVGCREHR